MTTRGRRLAAALIAACCTITLAGCGADAGRYWRQLTGTKLGTPSDPPWVRTKEKLWALGSVHGSYVAVRINAQKRFELVALSRRSGKTTHRVAIDPFRKWDDDSWFRHIAGGGAIAFHRASKPKHDRLDYLDPTTLKRRWSFAGAVESVDDCGPDVCVRDTKGVTRVLDGKSGRQRYRTRDAIHYIDGIVRVRVHQEGYVELARIDRHTGATRWRTDTFAPVNPDIPHDWKTVSWDIGGIDHDQYIAFGMTFHLANNKTKFVGTSVYDSQDGQHRWSKRYPNLFQPFQEPTTLRHDTVLQGLDGRTGSVDWALRAPSGTTYDSLPLTVDVLGHRWIGVTPKGEERTAYYALNSRGTSPLPRDRTGRSVVFTYAGEQKAKVSVGGHSHQVFSTLELQPTDPLTGKPTKMPPLPLPRQLRSFTGTELGLVVDKDGYGILEPARG